jgi:Protein of unknown function (DUF1194)
MRAGTRLIALIAIVLLLRGALTACAAEEVDLLLVLSSDVSRSIDAPKFKLQRDGYAAAIVNPRVIQAICYRRCKSALFWRQIGEGPPGRYAMRRRSGRILVRAFR